jgi:type II secretory ATPase GspE/PulE/Tfp pilus assembly ATPase PilB-like protein
MQTSEPRPQADGGLLWIDLVETDPQEAVRLLLDHACQHQVSDLFFASEAGAVSVAARHLGLYQRVTRLSAELGKRCIAHIKGVAGMDITERRRPQDGRLVFPRGEGEPLDLRINTMPTLHGEDCTLRLLDRSARPLTIAALGMNRHDHNRLMEFLSAPSGLLLVTGPTGAGKTTTLYACLNHLNNGALKINTIEDPIEYELPGVRQTQVNPKIDLGFAEVLRAVLRQSPDVIMVGEIRDPETAQTAVRAANSGHLVLATMHAPISAAAVQAILQLGVHRGHLATSLIGIIAQRLVRALNVTTRVPWPAVPQMFEEVRPYLAEGEGEQAWRPSKPRPGVPPYVGRAGVYEVMSASHAIRSLIAAGQTAAVVRAKAIEEGMIGLRQAALIAVARGTTSVEEVFRVIPSEYLLDE